MISYMLKDIYNREHTETLTDKIMNWNLVLGWDVLHEIGIIFHFDNKISFNLYEVSKT